MKFLKALSVLVVLFFQSPESYGQKFLYFRFTDGTQGLYPLGQVKNLGFANNQTKLTLLDGTSYAWPLATIDHYKYVDSLATSNRATKMGDPWKVAVYPNPSDGKQWLRFWLPTSGNAEITVVDMAGRLVFKQNVEKLSRGQQEIRLNWPLTKPGSYLLQLKCQNFSVTRHIERI